MSRFERPAVEGDRYQEALDERSDSERSWYSDSERGPSLAWRRVLSIAVVTGVASAAVVLGTVLFGPVHMTSSRRVAKTSHTLQFDALSRQSPFAANMPAATSYAQNRSLLKPVEHLHDGNVCESNEELFEGLCYHKCSLLTMNKDPIRSSPWSCCAKQPCLLPKNEAVNVGKLFKCSGHAVSGSGGCPHRPGACLTDEELHLGECFKKCDILTNGKFPHRVAAATCCKVGGLGCLNIMNDRTNAAYAVGGGAGDHDPSTPSKVHGPEARLTEVAASHRDAATEAAVSGALSTAGDHPRPEPIANMSGNFTCGDEEELYGGLCYRKCGLLTYGQNPIRTSSWTCCEAHPCGLKNQKGSVGSSILCNGYDIAGNGKCPMAPKSTACADDEEQLLGICYRKCSILTKGDFPHRVAAATCCKTDGIACLNFLNDRTSDAFNVGSGVEEKKAEAAEEGGESQEASKVQFSQGKAASAFMMKKK